MNNTFKYLTKLFQKLPGVGPRQAARFVLSMLDRRQDELEEFGHAILELKYSIRLCRDCFNVADGEVCHICSDNRRDKSKLMVVEKITDLAAIEKSGLYNGHYHVLGGAIDPVDGVNPGNLRFPELSARLTALHKTHPSVELISATNPTVVGDTTYMYMRETLGKLPGVQLTRLARGLASGSNLEYADELTLKHALDERK